MQAKHNHTTEDFLAAMSEQAGRWKEIDFEEILGRLKEAYETVNEIDEELKKYGLVHGIENVSGELVYSICPLKRQPIFVSKLHKP